MTRTRRGRSDGTRRPGRSGAGRAAARRPRVPRWAACPLVGVLLVLFLLGLRLVGPTAARSDADFGTLGLDQSDYGSVVSLRTPAAGLYQEGDEFVVHRDAVQSANNDPGLIQAGVYRSGSEIGLDNCGGHPGYVVFTEVKPVNSMAYKCQLYAPVSPGSVVTIDIFRFKAPATWGIRIDGVPTATYRLGFTRGSPAIGSEIQDLDSNYRTETSTRFAPAGHAQWSVYAAVQRRRVRRVSSRDPLFAYPTTDRFWRLGRLPRAIIIKHRHA